MTQTIREIVFKDTGLNGSCHSVYYSPEFKKWETYFVKHKHLLIGIIAPIIELNMDGKFDLQPQNNFINMAMISKSHIIPK